MSKKEKLTVFQFEEQQLGLLKLLKETIRKQFPLIQAHKFSRLIATYFLELFPKEH